MSLRPRRSRARVVLDGRLACAAPGGIAVYVRELAARFPALDPDREHLQIVRQHPGSGVASGHPFIRGVFTPAHHRFERMALGIELWALRPDILHSPDFVAPMTGFRHSVITVHDLAFLRNPSFLTRASRRYYQQVFPSARRADAVLADSDTVRRDVIDLLGVPPARVVTVPLGRDERCGGSTPDATSRGLELLGLTPGYLLCVATFDPRKNLEGLLRSYKLLRDTVKHAPPLVLAGHRTPYAARLQAWMTDGGWHRGVQLRFDVQPDAMPALHAGARLFVLLSHDEGFGLPVVDAMASGTPCVVARRGALPEIAGDAAVLVGLEDEAEAADAMQRLLEDDGLVARLRRAGVLRAATYSWDLTARRTLEVYDEVLGT
jgi:glycosyltransferase involved in cell wall biosynthesis